MLAGSLPPRWPRRTRRERAAASASVHTIRFDATTSRYCAVASACPVARIVEVFFGHQAAHVPQPATLVPARTAVVRSRRLVGVRVAVVNGPVVDRHPGRKEQFRLDLQAETLSVALSSTSLIASAMTFAASSSCHWRSSAGMGTAGRTAPVELAAGVDTTCTRVSGTLRTVASCAAHRAATLRCRRNRQPRPRLPDVLGRWTFALPPIAISFRQCSISSISPPPPPPPHVGLGSISCALGSQTPSWSPTFS